jgi:hypothetical protein
MADPITIALGLGFIGVLVYAVGFERTTTAAKGGASKVKKGVRSSYGLAAAGAASGLMAGDALVQFVASDPATLIAAVTGIVGTLGIGGVLDLTALQYAMIAGGLLVGYYAWFASTEED